MKRILFGIIAALLWIHQLHDQDRVRIGYSSISGAYTPNFEMLRMMMAATR